LEKSEDIIVSSAEEEEEESTSLLEEVNLSRFDDKRVGVIGVGIPTDKIFFENETVGGLIAFGKRSSITAIGRKATRLSFIESAHVIQINSSKESQMRALPSEKFWRRNQRRVSNMPTVEEAQMAKS